MDMRRIVLCQWLVLTAIVLAGSGYAKAGDPVPAKRGYQRSVVLSDSTLPGRILPQKDQRVEPNRFEFEAYL
jgi:hypothetical protein